MKDHISQWAERFDAFSLRERGLITAVIVVLMIIVWDTMVLAPQELKQKKIVGEMRSLNQQMEDLSNKVKFMTEKLPGGEMTRVEARISELQGLLSGLERKQQDLTVEFIRPEQMAVVLRDMLNNEHKLTLTRLESLGAEPFFPPVEKTNHEDSLSSAEAQGPNIYKHGMRVVFEGDFNSTLNYLQSLESMAWRFYWDNLEYQVLEYPIARVVITVHTLSLDKGWIGV